MAEQRIYRGVIAEHGWGEADDILFLSGVKDPLAEAIQEDIGDLGHFLTVRYWISDREASPEELSEDWLRFVAGAGDVKFGSYYPEITGYLWTDEELNVGGHDLLAELRSQVGKFCHLEITFSGEAG